MGLKTYNLMEGKLYDDENLYNGDALDNTKNIDNEKRKRPWLVGKRLAIFFTTLLILIFIFKSIIYFMPFFIAGIIALIIEPIIKFFMEKFKMSRRVSSAMIITLTIILIIALVTWGTIFAVNEIIKFSKDIGPFITNISETFEKELEEVSAKLINYLPKEVIETIMNSITDFVTSTGGYIQGAVGKIMEFILSVPTVLVNVIVTILALIFFTKDRIYIIDAVEHHFPKKWTKSLSEVINEIFSTLGSYVKVYGKILLVTFAELFLAFSILRAIGFKIENLVVLAVGISVVDILPVLGVGTVLIPWIAWQFLIGNIKFGIALTIVYIIILIIRQLIEPKLVSKQLGVHPLTTLFAMYAGFKYFGFSGLIFGPIILMVLKCIFNKQLEKGFFKDMFGDGA